MNKNAKKFMQTLDEKGIQYDVNEKDDATVVSVMTSAKKIKSITVHLIIDDDDKHVSLCCIGFVQVKPENYADALIACNECNQKYRWVKFVVDDDLDVNALDDAVTSPDTAGEELCELMLRMMALVDECYPVFMKNIFNS